MPRLSAQDLDALRNCVRSEYANASAESFEQIMGESLAALPTAATEDFRKTLGSFGQALGPALQRSAPGMARGASKGAAVGGPWGAVIGAGAGLASTSLRRPRAARVVPGVEPALPELPIGQNAAATLIGLLQNATVQQSLLSQVLGSNGRERVSTGSGVTLPRAAINGLLTQLLATATEGLPEAESISEQDYLLGETGEYLVDPGSPEQQAALVLSHLQSEAWDSGESNDSLGKYMDEVEWMSEETEDLESADWDESEVRGETVEFY